MAFFTIGVLDTSRRAGAPPRRWSGGTCATDSWSGLVVDPGDPQPAARLYRITGRGVDRAGHVTAPAKTSVDSIGLSAGVLRLVAPGPQPGSAC